jgi:lipoprotein-anchoring transpeptidase ErfK/SrfK
MAKHVIAVVIVGIALGGCMQETIEPATQAGWTARDKQLMSNLPYAQAAIPEPHKRHIVEYTRKEAPGTILIDSDNKFLYYVLPKGQAIR